MDNLLFLSIKKFIGKCSVVQVKPLDVKKDGYQVLCKCEVHGREFWSYSAMPLPKSCDLGDSHE